MDLLKKKFEKPEIEYWPEVRWWLAEGFHTDETLKKDIQMLYDAGFGAVEFLAMDEQGADSSRYGWGSEEWIHDSQLIIKETTKKKMGASLTSGTNWSNANLTTITPDDKAAAKELDFTVETVAAGQTRTGILEKVMPAENLNSVFHTAKFSIQELIAVVAVKRVSKKENKVYLDKNTVIVLTEKVEGEGENRTLHWTAPDDGEYELFTFWMHGTGQIATPSVSVSYTINYLDKYGVEALIDYWNKEVITPELKNYIKQNGRVQMYMDSLELSTFGKGGQLWGYHLLEEFKKRRGYDLTPYLPFIIKITNNMMPFGPFNYYYEDDDTKFIDKVRIDLYQTMTELYMDNMLKPLQEWLHSIGMTLRAEISYGLPFEISQPGKYVDGIETESLEFASQIEPFRNLAGPAHLYNRLYSSETGATMMNYMMGLDFYTQIIFTQFAAGVSRTVLHGYSSIAGIEDSTHWPGHEGMWPIFSERFGCRQPAYQHYNDWTTMLARYQMILRQGTPRVDIGILRLDYNFNNMYMMFDFKEKSLYESRLLRANEGIYWKDMMLQNSGYTYDYFSPQILEEDSIEFRNGVIAPNGPGYKALIIYQEGLPLSSAEQILRWAKEGLPVVIVNGATETLHFGINKTHAKAASMTPFNDNMNERLAEVMSEMKALCNVLEVNDQSQTCNALMLLGVYPRAKFSEPNKNILTFMREDGHIRYLYVYNYMYTDKENFTCKIAIDGIGKPYEFNCWTGEINELGIYSYDNGCTIIEITLQPGEATVIALNLSEKDKVYAVSSNAHKVLQASGKIFVLACESGTYRTELSDGSVVVKEIEVPDNIDLKEWYLEVEDWNEGEKVTIQEDRGLGYVTKEVYYETKKTKIQVGKTELKPWKDISAVGEEVSGVGYYTTTFKLPETWSENNGAYLKIGSTNGNSAAVYVNGKKAPAVDFNSLKVDISELLVLGENIIKVEVSSTLNNRLKARGYYDKILNFESMMSGGIETIKTDFQDYGMTGEVTIVTYTIDNIF
ncbi:hypothetical protein M2651_06640 [Clostridium sp. SYSU_GA19001]|uniref:glycosyl hydrolase n=1 Tax=Clostridium caldaquaticum TaxID=2940653 RepID=UPI002076D8AD|nr:glycosyl hydrolase [Clostridium caldaquaticum]MCM8710704.1 hypothetical protein [Clostridium caldaquaticum]